MLCLGDRIFPSYKLWQTAAQTGAVLRADEDPDRLSFLHSVRVVQRRMARSAATPLGTGKLFMKRSLMRLCKSAAVSAATGLIHVA